MKVLVSSTEKWQLEYHFEVLNNPYESIAKRRLAKSKFDLIYSRARKRSLECTSTHQKDTQFAQLNEGEH